MVLRLEFIVEFRQIMRHFNNIIYLTFRICKALNSKLRVNVWEKTIENSTSGNRLYSVFNFEKFDFF